MNKELRISMHMQRRELPFFSFHAHATQRAALFSPMHKQRRELRFSFHAHATLQRRELRFFFHTHATQRAAFFFQAHATQRAAFFSKHIQRRELFFFSTYMQRRELRFSRDFETALSRLQLLQLFPARLLFFSLPHTHAECRAIPVVHRLHQAVCKCCYLLRLYLHHRPARVASPSLLSERHAACAHAVHLWYAVLTHKM